MPDTAGTQDKKMVFLFCSERCGSNLVSSIMGSHPDIYSPPPYHLGRDLIQNLHSTLGLGPGSLARNMLSERLLKTVRKTHSEQAAEQLGTWLSQYPEASGAEITRYVYTEFNVPPECDTIFIKENNLHRILFHILQCFPDARFVFQVRDPRDFLASAKARRDHWLGNKFGSDRNALAIWRDDQLGALTALACLGPARVFFQRYEDLIGHPREVLTALCHFLDKRFDESMLDFHESKAVAHLAEGEKARENLSKPLMSDNFGKYRSKLSKRSIRMVETHVGEFMDRFGYARDFPRRAKPLKWDILRLQLTEPFEMYLNGHRSPFYSSVSPGLYGALMQHSALIEPRYSLIK